MVDGTLALSIPGLFLTCVQYFTLVQLGRNFKNDFGSCLLQLRAIELRLQRWGRAAGITDATSEDFVKNLQERHTPQEIEFAYNACKHIKKQLSRAQEDSQDIVDENPGQEMLELVDEVQQLEICGPPTARASRVVNKLKSGYHSSLRFATKATSRTQWALYKKVDLEKLLAVIGEHVTTLEKLFPEQEKALVVAEAKDMEPEVMEALAPVLDSKDPLANAIQGVREGIRYEDIEVMGFANPHLGSVYNGAPQNEGSVVFKGLRYGDHASGQAGNIYNYNA